MVATKIAARKKPTKRATKKAVSSKAKHYGTCEVKSSEGDILLITTAQKENGDYYGTFRVVWHDDATWPVSGDSLAPDKATAFERLPETICRLLDDAYASLMILAEELPAGNPIAKRCVDLTELISSADEEKLARASKRNKAKPETNGKSQNGTELAQDNPAKADEPKADQAIDLAHFKQSLLSFPGKIRTQVEDWPVDKIVEHPENRELDQQQVDRLAELFQQEGQRDAIECRVTPNHWSTRKNGCVPEGHIQSLRGRHRRAAAKKLGWDFVRVVILAEVDDTEALRLIARGDDQRKWNELDKGRMVMAMREAGLTLEEAAAEFGAHKGTASHWCGAASLPECWQRTIDPGIYVEGDDRTIRLPASWLRPLEKYSKAAKLLESIHARFVEEESGWQAGEWTRSKKDFEECIVHVLDDMCRPVDKDDRPLNVWCKNGYKQFGRMFELTPDIESELEIVELIDGKLAALNCDRWDELNRPFFEDLKSGKITPNGNLTKAGKAGSSPTKKAVKKQLTKAQQKAAAKEAAAEKKRKTAEQAKKLKVNTERWLDRVKRQQIARNAQPGEWWLSALMPALMIRDGVDHFKHWRARVVNYVTSGKQDNGYDFLTLIAKKMDQPPATKEETLGDLYQQIVSLLFWPIVDGKVAPHGSLFSRSAPPRISDPLFYLPSDLVNQAAEWAKFDGSVFWDRASEPSDEQTLVAEFFELHTNDQLSKLCKEFGVELSANKKGDKVEELIGVLGDSKQGLKVPKCLAKKR